MATIDVSIRHRSVPIDRAVFGLLCENSVIAERAEVRNALTTGRIRFSVLEELARQADIPPAMFFASADLAAAQVRRKLDVLLAGVSKNEFSLNSRGSVRLTDVELIIKDVLRKQTRLKQLDPGLGANTLVGALRKRAPVTDAADLLRSRLELDLAMLRSRGSKGKAFEHLVALLETHNIFVSQSVRNWMPQNLPPRARFSGMCIKDKAIPFIFINGADARGALVPAGRQLLTLVLLSVCVARARFQRVSYNEQADSLIHNLEYEIAEEVLMPATEVSGWDVDSLEEVRAHADTCVVTPTAFLMRARRLRLVDDDTARVWLNELREEFRALKPTPTRSPLAVNALRKYNSTGYCRAFLHHYDTGAVSASEVVRFLFHGRLKAADIDHFRASL